MTLEFLPTEIIHAVRKRTAGNRGYARVPSVTDGPLFALTLTPADAEEACACHTNKARAALARFAAGKRAACKPAADHILRARWYRRIYRSIIGMPCPESDMPFPYMTTAEAGEVAR
jgi:hypothetical protein